MPPKRFKKSKAKLAEQNRAIKKVSKILASDHVELLGVSKAIEFFAKDNQLPNMPIGPDGRLDYYHYLQSGNILNSVIRWLSNKFLDDEAEANEGGE